ncbi:MAG TPA: hypothetical protein PK388_04245, partial [Kiritimatiellia bacterium]|nr:hypothetical protein [Kiritimatiellia bacterium]
MLEPDIVRKCATALAAAAAFVAVSVLASWWTSAAAPDRSAAAIASAAAAPPAGAAPGASGVSRAGAAPKSAAPRNASAAAGPRDDFEKKAFRLEMENARLRARLDDMLNWILDNVRGTFPLPEGQLANLRVVPVDTNMQTSADLAEVLRLSDEEIDKLDTAFLGTRSVLQELETEKISVDQPAEKQVVLNIPPYAEEGELVRAELYGELKRTLGAGRFDRFLQVAEAGLDEKFEYFGNADRTLEFEEVTDAVSGAAQLYVRDERALPSKDDPLRQDITASERLVTE